MKEQLLQQEKSLLKSQNEWLSSELQSKSEQVLSLRKEKASCQSELENKLSQKQEEVGWYHNYVNESFLLKVMFQ